MDIKFPKLDKQTKEEFILDYNGKTMPYFRFSLIFILLTSIPYTYLDLSLIPQNLNFVWIVRFAIWVPIIVISFILTYFPIYKRYSQLIGSILILTIGFGVEAMIAISDKSELAYTMYYVGIAIVMLGVLVLRFRFKPALIVLLLLLTGYIFVAVYFQKMHTCKEPINYAIILLNNVFFLLSFTSIVLFTVYILERLSIDNFMQKQIILQEQAVISEKNEDLNQQNEEIEAQRDEITIQKSEIEKAHKHVLSSVNYAKRIQNAMLPTDELFKDHFAEHFILFKPRDIVSGDFYWAKKIKNTLIFAAADSTGHGVPGAFVSMLGMSLLNEIAVNSKITTVGEILDNLRSAIKTSLKQIDRNSESKDGMDIALCSLNLDTNELQYAGAYNPLYIIRESNLIELKADKQPIAIHIKEKKFTTQYFNLQKDDIVYLFSDGYIDQFKGLTDEKFMTKRFKKLLNTNTNISLPKQKQILEQTFTQWQGKGKQLDDIVILGARIK